jgi:hypothetical protein
VSRSNAARAAAERDRPESQCAMIRDALLSGEEVTPLAALRQFGCLRLAARIADLRATGLRIETETEMRGGKRFAKYRLARAFP